jgi:hypothetical protein
MTSTAEASPVPPISMNTKRSLFLAAAGAIAGLAIAGYGLFKADGTLTRAVPAEAVAVVNRQPILRGDFAMQLETETGQTIASSSRDAQLKMLDNMVREELLVQRGLELNFGETDQDVRNALVSAVTRQITAQVATAKPSQQQLQAFYGAHRDQFTTEGKMSARHFVVAKPHRGTSVEPRRIALEAAEALRTGATAESVMRRFAVQEPERYEEDYYFTLQYKLGEQLFGIARELKAGEVSDPIQVGEDLHFVQLLVNEVPQPLTFEAAGDQVLSRYKEAEESRMMDATIEFLRSRSNVVIASDYASDYRR